MSLPTIPRKSFAMVLAAPRRFEPRELPIPEIDDDSALLEVEVCGICGSDVEQFEGALRTPTPVVPGHEPLGRIARIGDRAARRWGVDVGDRVAVENIIACRFCANCVGGRPHLCAKRKVYSYVPLDEAPGLWGAYAQHLWLHPDSALHRVDPALPAAHAVMFNPLGAGFRWAVEIAGTKPGDTVLILGPGQRGLACVVAARAAGAAKILVTGLTADAKKLALARELGADVTIDVEQEDLRARVREATNGRGADVVVEVTAYATQPILDAIDVVALGGTIVLAGVKGFVEVPRFVSDKIVIKELRVLGAIGVTSSAYRNAIRLLERGGSGIERMHTHAFPLEEAEQAIRTLARRVPGVESIHSCLVPPPL